jgi:aspartate ammonia-lyase
LVSTVTALVQLLGYKHAAALAQEAMATGKTIRELARETPGLAHVDLGDVLDPSRLESL